MDFSWVYDNGAVNWDELSALYRIAPLGEKSPEDLATVFSNSRYKCFVYLDNNPVALSVLVAAGSFAFLSRPTYV